MVVLAGSVGGQASFPDSALAVFILVPGDSAADTISLCLNDIIVAVLIEVNDPCFCHQRVSGVGLAEVNVFVRGPFCSFSIEILEPDIRTNHVDITIAVDVGSTFWVDTAVDRRTYFMFEPVFCRVGGAFIPEQAAPVAHSKYIGLSICI